MKRTIVNAFRTTFAGTELIRKFFKKDEFKALEKDFSELVPTLPDSENLIENDPWRGDMGKAIASFLTAHGYPSSLAERAAWRLIERTSERVWVEEHEAEIIKAKKIPKKTYKAWAEAKLRNDLAVYGRLDLAIVGAIVAASSEGVADTGYKLDEKDDIEVLQIAIYFSQLPLVAPSVLKDFIKASDLKWGEEQEKMVGWFASQVTLDAGNFRREAPNHSFRATWEALDDPSSLLWVACVLGADKGTLESALKASQAEQGDGAAKCEAIRKVIPFGAVLATARKIFPNPDSDPAPDANAKA